MDVRWASEWLADQHQESQREFVRLLIASLVGHAVLVAAFAWLPRPPSFAVPEVLTVDLVAAPRPATPARPAPKPPAATPTPPKAVAKPAPPKPQRKEIVLPKRASEAVPKRKPAPRPAETVEPIEKLSYDDALSSLREEMGEEAAPDPELLATVEPSAAPVAPAQAGVVAPPEIVAWQRATVQRLRERWVTPPEFLDKNVTTLVKVTLTATGALVGPPTIERASGDPYWDENAVRAVLKAAPLPAPPEPGDYTIAFRPEDR